MSDIHTRILAIDDSLGNLDLIGNIIKAYMPEAELLTALSGKEGLELAQNSSPDIVLLDVLMPEMDGYEVCRSLKSNPVTEGIPVLMISGVRIATGDRTAGIDKGADGYICKPYGPAELMMQMKALLRIKRSEEQLRKKRDELDAELTGTLAELQHQQEYLKSLFDRSPDAIFVEDAEGTVLDVNPQACSLHGLTREELVGKNVLDLVPPEERERVAIDFPKWSKDGIDQYEGFSYSKDGRAIPVEIRRSSIMHLGKEAHLLHVRDISDRKEAEEKLQFTEFSLDRASLAAFWIAEDASFAFVNEASCERLGYSRDELLNMGVPDIDPLYTKDVWPEHWKVFTTERVLTFESIHRRKDGTTFPVEITANYVEVGERAYMCAFASDITDRKETENALKRSEVRFRELVQLLPELIFEISPEGRVLFANQTGLEMFGYSEEELATGMNAYDMFARADVPRVMTNMGGVLRGENTGRSEYMAKRKDGSLFPISAHVAPIIQDGEAVGIRGIGVDITDLKRAEEIETRMMQADKLESIGVLAGGIAHDFNNILMSIMGYCDLALEDVKEGKDVLSHLQEILAASTRAKTLIQQIQTFSRSSESQRKQVDVRSVTEEALHFLRVSIPTTIHIETDLRECGTIEADTTQIHQVVMNLCTNAYQAMDATKTGGLLRVVVEPLDVTEEMAEGNPDLKAGSYVRLSVSDNGPGISHNHLGRIFDPFFTTKGPGKGTGLGLSVVHGIVAGHHGAIMVNSEPGKGTAFHIYLPSREKHDDSGSALGSGEAPPRGTEKILFVDDEERISELGRKLLGTLGYSVENFSKSEEALEAFRADPNRYDAVLTDLAMPGLTGTELATAILHIRSDIPVIICTGYNQTVTLAEVKRIGVERLVRKPFTRDQIAKELRDVLDGRKG